MTDDVAADLLIWAVFGHAGDGNSDRRGVPAISPASPQNAHEHPTAPVSFSADDDQPYQSDVPHLGHRVDHGGRVPVTLAISLVDMPNRCIVRLARVELALHALDDPIADTRPSVCSCYSSARPWPMLVHPFRHGRMTSSVRAFDALLVLGQIIAAIGPPPLVGGRLA